MRVFRTYDQAGLEAQYDSASRDPHLNALRDERAKRVEAESAHVRKTARARLDLAYGKHPRERIDLFQADKPGGPVLAFFHGGYWKMRSKDEFAYLAPPFTARGINLATIGYPLCPEVTIADIVDSCRRALLHLWREGKGLGLDPGAIHVAGHSAGGHLTAMMMATDFAALAGPADLVRSATAVSGLYDLEPLRLVKVNAELRIEPKDVAPLSPLRLSPRSKAPLTLTVGGAEGEEFIRNTTELGEAWRSKGTSVTMIDAPGLYHFNILDHLVTPGKALFERVLGVLQGRT